MKPIAYTHPSPAGTFTIRLMRGRWHVLFQDEDLGSYPTPQQALDDLAGGHTYTLPGGHDSSAMGLSEDLGDWTPHPR